MLQGGNDEKEQTLNQLLAELDGFDPRSGVVLLGATNRPEVLDPALLRAGRFDRQVLVDRPDRIGRAQILAVHLQKIRLAAGVDVDEIAALTPGFTGADLAGLVNEAALLATRRDATEVTIEDFNQAVERVIAGLEKRSRILNAHEREVVAHHEIGHALVAMALPGVDPVQKISIIPRGVGALGYTIQRPLEDRFLMTRAELMNRMAVLLGGRAAETVIFHEISTGAEDDLVKATDIARSMVVRFGMDLGLGQVAYEAQRAQFLQAAGRRRVRAAALQRHHRRGDRPGGQGADRAGLRARPRGAGGEPRLAAPGRADPAGARDPGRAGARCPGPRGAEAVARRPGAARFHRGAAATCLTGRHGACTQATS